MFIANHKNTLKVETDGNNVIEPITLVMAYFGISDKRELNITYQEMKDLAREIAKEFGLVVTACGRYRVNQ